MKSSRFFRNVLSGVAPMAALFDHSLAPHRAVSHQPAILQRSMARPQGGPDGLRLPWEPSPTATA